MCQYLSASCEPLGLLVEEPEVGGPEKAVEEAKEDRDVALAELGAGAAAIDLRVPHCQSVKKKSDSIYRILLAEHGSNRQARADIFQAYRKTNLGQQSQDTYYKQHTTVSLNLLGPKQIILNISYWMIRHVNSFKRDLFDFLGPYYFTMVPIVSVLAIFRQRKSIQSVRIRL